MLDPTRPLILAPNRPRDRFYAGGSRIDGFRGDAPGAPHTPEDWLASTVAVRGESPAGLTHVDGESLAAAVDREPLLWLGAAHVERFGADPMILVKLLDAGQRLPIHVHPNRAFARTHLGSAHGKTEAWHILTPGVVYLGLKDGLEKSSLAELVRQQRVSELLARMWEIRVEPGDRVLVPAGMLHAIGEGVLLVEAQEPEDLSILLEWEGFAIDGTIHGHLDLGFDLALDAVDTSPIDEATLAELIARGDEVQSGLPSAAAEFFALESFQIHGAIRLADGWCVVVCVDGAICVSSGAARTTVRKGQSVLVSAAVLDRTLEGDGCVVVARPPEATSSDG